MVYKKKILITLIIFGFFVFPNFAKACGSVTGWMYTDALCMAPYCYGTVIGTDLTNNCISGIHPKGTCYALGVFPFRCQEVTVYEVPSDGDSCYNYWGWFCEIHNSGRWDARESKCVDCWEGKEIGIFKCYEAVEGNKKCESACGADKVCDEATPASDITQCDCGKTYFADACDSDCYCTDRGDNICRSRNFAPDCTADPECDGKHASSTLPDGGSCTAECKYIPSPPPPCSGNLSVSVSGAGTCTVTASVTTTNCDGKSWAIKDDGDTKCSGTVSGSSYATSCSWTVSVGNYTYNLYIGGEKKGTASANCPTTQKYSLTITKLGDCSGKVKNSGINCGTDCSEEYSKPINVTLTATPDSPCYFGGWGGACSGTQSTCQLTVDSEKTVTATFSTCKPVGASCSSNNECCSGICKDGKCYCKPDGESCSSGEECCSGYCYGGFCATPNCSVDSFTLTPSSVPPGGELVVPSARVWSYLGGCGYLPTIYFKAGSCTGPTVSSCTLTSCGNYLCCSGNPFVAPSTIGNYIYYACIQNSSKFAVLKVSDCNNECKQSGYSGGTCRIGTIPAYFGDGSDGDKVFSSNGTIDTDKNYENLTINSGVKVTVKSGVKIRVRGTLKVYGILSGTGQGGKGGGCTSGQNGTCSGDFGGRGGKGGDSYYGRTGGSGGNYGGGGGAGGGKDFDGYNGGSRCGGGGGTCTSNYSYVWGGSGGGEIDIYARRIEIYENGKIESSGTNGGGSIYWQYGGGGGGGGGKIYIYFGSGGFKNLGTIEAKGGNGANGDTWQYGGGGGGGGGYIKVVGPTDAILGKTDVSGGKGGGTAQYAGSPGENGSVAKEIDLSLADTPTSCSAGEVSIGDDNCGKNVNCCCLPSNQPPTASFSCDSSLCSGGDSANCIMYQPTSDINTCVFTLRNNSTDTDGTISQTKWYIKKKTEPDSSYREIGSCSQKCDHTIQITDVPDPAIYTVKLYVEDDKGASSTITKDLTVKREIKAGFMCSLDNSNWKSCESITIFPGQTLFLKDDPSLTEHSVPSEGAIINSRTWQKGDGVNFETFALNTTNPTTTLTINQKVIRLIVKDNATRSDREDHQLSVTYPLPFFKEIPPVFFKMKEFFASLILKIRAF